MKNREDAWLFVYQSYRDLEQVRQVRNECQQGNKGEESNKALHWTWISLRSVPATELWRWATSNGKGDDTMGIARSATVYVIMAVIVGICGCGTCQHDAYTEPKQHEVELSPRQEVSAHIEETSPPKPEFQDRLQAVEGNALEAKAQREDTRSTFTVDQQIGLSSSETTLTLDSKGVTYRNENMKVDRFIPWSAIIEWQGKYLGKGRPGSPKARTEFFSFRINVNNDAIPREKRHLTIAATGWLTFRFDWRGDAVAAFDLAKQHHPKGTVDMR